MSYSLFIRFLKIYFLVVVIIIFSFFFLSKNIIKKWYIKTSTNYLRDLSYLISVRIKDKKILNLQPTIEDLSKQLKVKISVINSSGIVLADFGQQFVDGNVNNLSTEEVEQVLKNSFNSSIGYKTIKEDILHFATPIRLEEDLLILKISYSLKDVHVLMNNLLILFVKILAFVTLVVVLFSLLISYSITKPIKQLITATRKISEGDLSVETSIKATGEIKVLVDNFNLMVSKIKKLLEDVSYERDRIKNIFSSIQEAVVLLDTDGKILLYNDKFKQLCKVSPQDKYYFETLVASEFNEIIKKSIQTKENLVKEINVSEEVYLCSVSFISEKELVVLLYNITEHRDLQSIKKELILNIIHELKTPLTSIKGFSETLYDEVKNSEHKNYVERILFNTDRLVRIVNDLSTLSSLEQKNIELEITDVDLVELINFIEELFIEKIKQKKLEFIKELQTGLKPIKADRFHIEQLLINLVDNAVRYTDKGFIKIKISQNDKTTFLEIEDTGIGIPKEYHQRVFERFFVVDKARSRKTGGTGLGLAIVKHIVELHKGKIFLESQLGVGTKFKVVLNNEL
ncbi:MAG: ATP-binding protein [Elusimicrobiota bacterium]|nr:ATP-binding protein [Elusimicrobiota bacterium]